MIPLELPTVPNTLDELQLQVADIAQEARQDFIRRNRRELISSLKNANTSLQPARYGGPLPDAATR